MVRKKFKRREITLSLGVISIIILILTFYIWHQIESVRLGYETHVLETRVQALMKEVETLEAKKSSLLSLERVEEIAKNKLGLRPPDENQVIYKDDSNGHIRR